MSQQLLVTTEWLHDHLTETDLRIVDIRGHVLPPTEPLPHYHNHRADYEVSHIPGAVFVDWVHEITDPADPQHAQIAKPERYAAVMSRLGIGATTQVVVYDDAKGMFAARLWWSLNYYGHTRVAVLDGGWDKWIAEGRPVTADVPTVAPAQFAAVPNPTIYRSSDQVLAALHSDVTLLDMRSLSEFNGESSRAVRAGHIPGAISNPRSTLANADGTLLSPEQLRVRFAELGITAPDAEIVTYCNGGVSASFGLLALRAAGFTNIAMYDGSWKEWGNDVSKPIE
ncbi:MAG: sulfurtransferase [Anaerolineae bacterium]|nr:sulfurtransferase [Anaerolineae bacterium]